MATLTVAVCSNSPQQNHPESAPDWKPIHYSRRQVELMAQVRAFYNADFAKKVEAGPFSPEGDFVAEVISYFDLQLDGMGGFTWNPR